jgi:hypothetical protein
MLTMYKFDASKLKEGARVIATSRSPREKPPKKNYMKV